MSNTDDWYVTFIESIELSKNVMSQLLCREWIGLGVGQHESFFVDWIGSISCYFGLDWVKKKWPMSNSGLDSRIFETISRAESASELRPQVWHGYLAVTECRCRFSISRRQNWRRTNLMLSIFSTSMKLVLLRFKNLAIFLLAGVPNKLGELCADEGATTTVVCCTSAAGAFVPPLFLFKRRVSV